ncbi:MAG: hypothetical protein ABI780_04810 [Ardenticatenales bacterium]
MHAADDAVRTAQAAKVHDAQQEASQSLVVFGRRIACPICGHDRFQESSQLLNSRGLAFLDLSWLSAGAITYACRRCGHMLWFNGTPGELDGPSQE